MTAPRHISECITEWFTDYQEAHMKTDPFNMPDALDAIRAELCTCPTEGEWQIHLPGCGDAGWSDEDAAVEG